MTKKAFCVGINDYGHRVAPEMGMLDMDLKGCVNDAYDWANLLVRHYDFNVADVVLLTNGDATRQNILKGLKNLLVAPQKGDVLVFTNSSHGWIAQTDRINKPEVDFDLLGHHFSGRFDHAICPYDYPRLIIDDEFREIFDSIKASVNMTTISDSCFSGSLTEFSNSKKHKKTRRHPMEILLTGTAPHQLSGDALENNRNSGFMTYHAIKTITDSSYRLTYAELHEKMLASIAHSESKYKDQHPELEASEENKQLYIFTNELKT